MAEQGKLRLVRCPKCENLLPELPDYSVYQCGGCGAVLRANKSDVEGENGALRACEDRVRVSDEKQEDLKGKETVLELENGDCDDSKGFVAEMGKLEGDDSLKKVNEMGNENLVHLEPRSDEVKVHDGYANGSTSVGRVLRRKARESRREDDGFLRTRRGGVDGVRFVNGSYAGEGTSRCHWNCDLENERTLGRENGKFRSNKVEYKEAEREAILKKLDELRDQLSRTCDADVIKDKSSLEPRIVHPKPHPDEYFQDESPGIRGKSRQLCPETKHSSRPHCLDPCNEPLHFMNGYGTSMQHHPLMQNSDFVSRLEDSCGSHKMRRPPSHCVTSRHLHPTSHPYLYSSGHHVSPLKDLHEPFSPIHNQLSCSCYHCLEKCHQVPRHMPSSAFDSLRVPHVENKPTIPCHHELPSILGPRGCNSRACIASLTNSYGIDPHARWPRDLDLDSGGFAHSRPQRVVLANGGLHCRPVAGGSPFITCHNCFQLLKLSKKVLPSGKGQCRVCCGRCSSVISLSIVDGKLAAVEPPKKRTLKEVLDSSNGVVYEKPYRSCTDAVKLDGSSFRSEGYDIPSYDFHLADQVGTSEELPNIRSVSPSTSDDENCPLELNTESVVTNIADIPVNASLSLTTSSSPIDNFDDASKYQVVNRCGKGSLSSRSDQERAPAIKSILRQNSLKESMSTETESNDFPEIGAEDAIDAIREEDQPRGKRGIDAFLAGLIKKGFRDFSRSHHIVNRQITVNGHVVPYRLIKKAEKLAGPIYPGDYWYDYRAGFWGEMGGPCLGIIPPFIEEFNYSMLENCASGDSGVFVNGRELHHNDLDLLASRGLPSTRGRSYIIDISGRVVDEDTSEELDNLGRLAPTIEKVKHGFGMRVPKAVA